MHCMYRGLPKGTSGAEAMLNSEKIKPVSLVVIELCLSEGISQSVWLSVSQAVSQSGSQSVSRKFHLTYFLNSITTC